MTANGWSKTTVKPGDVITGIGYQYTDGQKIVRLEPFILADGKEAAYASADGIKLAGAVWAEHDDDIGEVSPRNGAGRTRLTVSPYQKAAGLFATHPARQRQPHQSGLRKSEHQIRRCSL